METNLPNSGRFAVVQPLPKSIHHKIGPLPGPLPLKVIFKLHKLEDIPGDNDKPSHRIGRGLQAAAIDRHRTHFGEPLWIQPDGRISRDPEIFTDQSAEPVEILILMRSHLTSLWIGQLPADPGPLSEAPRSGYSMERWRLCLGRAGDPEWHDHIMWQDGHFVINSVLIEREKVRS